jgi:hypothetical protein
MPVSDRRLVTAAQQSEEVCAAMAAITAKIDTYTLMLIAVPGFAVAALAY